MINYSNNLRCFVWTSRFFFCFGCYPNFQNIEFLSLKFSSINCPEVVWQNYCPIVILTKTLLIFLRISWPLHTNFVWPLVHETTNHAIVYVILVFLKYGYNIVKTHFHELDVRWDLGITLFVSGQHQAHNRVGLRSWLVFCLLYCFISQHL